MTWNSALNLLSRCTFRCPQWEPFGCSCGRLASRGMYQLCCVVRRVINRVLAPFCLCFITFVIKIIDIIVNAQCPLWLLAMKQDWQLEFCSFGQAFLLPQLLKPRSFGGPTNYGSSRRGQVFKVSPHGGFASRMPPFKGFSNGQAEAIEREEDQEWNKLQLSNQSPKWPAGFEKLLTWRGHVTGIVGSTRWWAWTRWCSASVWA